MPAIGTSAPSTSGAVVPSTPEEGATSGSMAAGTPSSSSSSGAQARAWMSNISVRAALVGSVTWRRPPVRRAMSQLSIVPNASSPAAARARSPATFSNSHASLVPEK